jgi:hypothetical protein
MKGGLEEKGLLPQIKMKQQFKLGHYIFELPESLSEDITACQYVVETTIRESLNFLSEMDWLALEEIFVHLHYVYFYRYTVPAFEITFGRMPTIENMTELKAQLQLCLVGRCVDDIIDQDSGFFSPAQSLVLYAYHWNQFVSLLSSGGKDLGSFYEQNSFKILQGIVEACHVEKLSEVERKQQIVDISTYPSRVAYFFLLPEYFIEKFWNDESREQRKSFIREIISTFFLYCDTEDVINDIFTDIATVPSQKLKRILEDNEGKLRLFLSGFLKGFHSLTAEIETRLLNLMDTAETLNLSYTYGVLAQTLNRLRTEQAYNG